ncbi:MAG TPA: lipocalin family protein [Chitinophagaceae bacterium]|nr:lipocalin family protein [Chitinophagaceae bacterium]
MKQVYSLCFLMTSLFTACTKENVTLPQQEEIKPHSAQSIYNPIVGKWELGAFKILCSNNSDTTIYPNERGDFVEFSKRDTAFYTYNTTNATGRSPYLILNSSTFVLGDTMHIIYNDGHYLTTYCKSSNGGSQQWMTYKKVGQ